MTRLDSLKWLIVFEAAPLLVLANFLACSGPASGGRDPAEIVGPTSVAGSNLPAATGEAPATASRTDPPLVRATERPSSVGAAEARLVQETDDPARPTPDPWYDASAGSTPSDDPALPAASATGRGGQPGRP